MSASSKYPTSIIFMICLVQICFYTQRHEFVTLFTTYAVFFATYLVVLNKTNTEKDLVFFINIGLLLRGVAVFNCPNLSDDIYRFLWDGYLINLGENPFSHPPQYYIENHLFSDILTQDLFSKLNSANYYSVYPTFCQIIFTVATFLFPKSLYGAMVVIKLCLLVCETGTILLIKKMLSSPLNTNKKFNNAVLIYALNPLIIIELIGNAHFEAAMIFFFVLAIFIIEKNRDHKAILSSGFVFALSVMAKMLPLMFLPLFFKKLGNKRSFFFWAISGVMIFILLMPIYNSMFFNNIGKSLSLYFNNFEFNASLFYLLRYIGFRIYGYNMIHQITPILTILVIIFILKKAFLSPIKNGEKGKKTLFFEDCLWVISIYFACATTVHPWYAALPLACSVFTKWRFPMVWTFFIFLTYSGYTEGSSKHTENMVLVGLEYIVVYIFFLYEWQKRFIVYSSNNYKL